MQETSNCFNQIIIVTDCNGITCISDLTRGGNRKSPGFPSESRRKASNLFPTSCCHLLLVKWKTLFSGSHALSFHSKQFCPMFFSLYVVVSFSKLIQNNRLDCSVQNLKITLLLQNFFFVNYPFSNLKHVAIFNRGGKTLTLIDNSKRPVMASITYSGTLYKGRNTSELLCCLALWPV